MLVLLVGSPSSTTSRPDTTPTSSKRTASIDSSWPTTESMPASTSSSLPVTRKSESFRFSHALPFDAYLVLSVVEADHPSYDVAFRLKPIDIEFMRRLHQKVNLIPVIAKSDTLTDDEIRAFKARVSDSSIASTFLFLTGRRKADLAFIAFRCVSIDPFGYRSSSDPDLPGSFVRERG